jgi:hypothetical protein
VAVWILLLLAAGCAAAQSGEVRGVVVDARGGEPMARVQVQLAGTARRTHTAGDGSFRIEDVPAGDHVLHVSTVGYRLLREPFPLAPGETKEFEIVLTPETLRRSESVEVRAGPFEPVREDSPSELTLEAGEAKNLASVLADDPLRAVQALPGVASNDDFNSRFAVRGAGYHRVGIYVDDVLVHTPFHTVVEETPTGSLTIFSGDTAAGLSLHPGAFPARYADRTAGAVDIRSRDGSRRSPSVRATASMSNAGAVAEGPLGRRGAWLASVRKSYLQYIIRRTSNDDTLAFGFTDGQGRLAYDLTSRHQVWLSLTEGFSDLDRTHARDRLGVNSPMLADYHVSLAGAGWRYAPREKLVFENRLAWMRERYDNVNRESMDLARGYYGEWVWNSNATWAWNERASLEFGSSVRRIRDDGFWNRYELTPAAVRRIDEYAGHGLRTGAFAEQAWQTWNGRLRLAGGLRWDWFEVNGVASVSPHAAVSVEPRPGTQLRLGWGQYVQHPDLRWMFMRIGSPSLLPERAHHAVASVEQRLNRETRLRAEFYDRADRDLLFRPFAEPRLIGGKVFAPPEGAPVRNSVRGYARGFEVFIQRRSANRLSGWLSYGYGRTGLRDGEAAIRFPSDTDQRHSVNLYGAWRLRPTVNLSGRYVYGSGFPIPGFFRQAAAAYYLAETRNALRVDDYHRLDLRLNKAWAFRDWKLTLYAEVINVLNQTNYRFDELSRFRKSDGRAYLRFDRMFPIIPSAGVAFEFGGK